MRGGESPVYPPKYGCSCTFILELGGGEGENRDLMLHLLNSLVPSSA